MAIADMRREFDAGRIDRGDMDADPLRQFQVWFDAAAATSGGRFRKFCVDIYKAFGALFGAKSIEANAMALATANREGQPSVRTVLLKGVDSRGFIFFTNYGSRKGCELTDNPRAALVFYWPELERQVCVAGIVTQISREESEAYFRTRPRKSQIGAAASDQSAVVSGRKELEEKFREIEKQFAGKEIPIPANWGGYVLKPARIEFWQGRASRMHDRFCYTRTQEGQWKIERLSP